MTRTAVNAKPAEALGVFAADEVSKLAGAAGSATIIVETPGPGLPATHPQARSVRLVNAQVEAFKERLRQKGRITLAPDVKLVRDFSAVRTEWPVGELTRLLRQQPVGTSLIFFCPLPEQMSEDERRMLRERSGKAVVVASEMPEVQPHLKERLIHLAIVRKSPVPPEPQARAETPVQWVQRVYAAVKPEPREQP